MAIANLHETLLTYTMRKAEIQNEISSLNAQKMLAALEQSDVQSLLNAGKSDLRNQFREMFENSPELQELYHDYTEIPEFEEEMEKLQAQYQEQLEELSNWETNLDNQITTYSAELEEINAYEESLKNMLSSNIQDDFNFGLN